MFNQCNGYSPVKQSYIWLGEYMNGTYLAEFDFNGEKENSFYDIEKEKLKKFGLIGNGNKFYVDRDGTFYLNGKAIEIEYECENKVYSFTGHKGKYSDIITYKDAELAINMMSKVKQNQSGSITQFNFGYKTILNMDGIEFKFKPICKIPNNGKVYINFWLVADSDLDGVLRIKANSRILKEIKAPLSKNCGGEVNIVIE